VVFIIALVYLTIYPVRSSTQPAIPM